MLTANFLSFRQLLIIDDAHDRQAYIMAWNQRRARAPCPSKSQAACCIALSKALALHQKVAQSNPGFQYP